MVENLPNTYEDLDSSPAPRKTKTQAAASINTKEKQRMC
jgi:hypothetical protein